MLTNQQKIALEKFNLLNKNQQANLIKVMALLSSGEN